MQKGWPCHLWVCPSPFWVNSEHKLAQPQCIHICFNKCKCYYKICHHYNWIVLSLLNVRCNNKQTHLATHFRHVRSNAVYVKLLINVNTDRRQGRGRKKVAHQQHSWSKNSASQEQLIQQVCTFRQRHLLAGRKQLERRRSLQCKLTALLKMSTWQYFIWMSWQFSQAIYNGNKLWSSVRASGTNTDWQTLSSREKPILSSP